MIEAFLPLLGNVIDSIFPDKEKQAEAKIALIKLHQDGQFKSVDAELKVILGQLAINKVEAGSDDKFKSRWRPAVGWVCVFGLAYATIIYPFLTWLCVVIDIPTPPVLDTATLTTTLFGLLGIGTLRSVEKYNGITK